MSARTIAMVTIYVMMMMMLTTTKMTMTMMINSFLFTNDLAIPLL